MIRQGLTQFLVLCCLCLTAAAQTGGTGQGGTEIEGGGQTGETSTEEPVKIESVEMKRLRAFCSLPGNKALAKCVAVTKPLAGK